MALTKAMFAGDDPTPESVKRRRAMAAALLAEGSQIRHVDSPLEMIGSLLQSGAGALNNYRADRDEKAGQKLRSDAQMKLAETAFSSGDIGAGAGYGFATGPIGDSSPTPTGKGVAASELAPYQAALLDTISGPESAGAYDVIYGGSKFADFSDHPRKAVPIANGPNQGKTSSAAGRYQFLGSTWDQYRGKLGLQDFSPANQDRAAYALAADTYRQKTGQDLDAVLQSGDPDAIAGVGRALAGVWTSLPGGIEQGTNTNRFVSAFQGGLSRYGSRSQSAAQPVQVASLNASDGVAEATGAPRTARQIVEEAAAKQGVNPANLAESGSADIQEIQSRPRDPQAVPYAGPGATIAPGDVRGLVPYTGPPLRDQNPVTGIAPVGMPGASAGTDGQIQRFHAENGTTPMQYRGPGQSGVPGAPSAQMDDPGAMQGGAQVAALDPVAGQPRTARQIVEAAVAQQEQANAPIPTPRPELMAAVPTPKARPSPTNAQGYATELPTAPPPPAGNVQQMGQLMLGDQSQGFGAPQGFGQPPYSQEMIAQLLGNPWTEDLGQQALQEVMAWRQNNQAMAMRQRELQQTRAYDRWKTMDERGYQDTVRREGYGREDERFAITDGREDRRLQLDIEKAEREARQPINVGGVLVDPQTFQPVYQPEKDPISLPQGNVLVTPDGRRIADNPKGPDVGASFDREQGLRKEYISTPEAKEYADIRSSYERLRASAQTGSGPGDLGVIFGYMKMLDPGSVVREGEFATAETAQGVPERVINVYNKLLTGERLTPDQRKSFVAAAGDLYSQVERKMQGINQRYEGIASQYGVDPRRVIQPLPVYEPLKFDDPAPASPTPAAPAAAQTRPPAARGADFTDQTGQPWQGGVPVGAGGQLQQPAAPPPGEYRWNPATRRMEAM